MKVELTKEEFSKYLNLIEQQMYKDEIFEKATEELSILNTAFSYDYSYILSSLIEFLKAAVNDEGDWLSWWLYENDCGKRGLQVWDSSDNEWDLKTPEDLWDFLHA